MSCLGVHFAIDDLEEKKILSFKDNDSILAYLQEKLEENYFKNHSDTFMAESDKAWDAIHRCLTDGEFNYSNGKYPLSHCIMGGKQLYTGDEYIISYKSKSEVQDISQALNNIDESSLKEKYWRINPKTYPVPLSKEDLEYTAEYFQNVKRLYKFAAESSRAVIFTADQ